MQLTTATPTILDLLSAWDVDPYRPSHSFRRYVSGLAAIELRMLENRKWVWRVTNALGLGSSDWRVAETRWEAVRDADNALLNLTQPKVSDLMQAFVWTGHIQIRTRADADVFIDSWSKIETNGRTLAHRLLEEANRQAAAANLSHDPHEQAGHLAASKALKAAAKHHLSR